MKHNHDPWEPEWMKTFREIQQEIARQVDRYIQSRNRFLMWITFCSFAGYWAGFLTVELTKWLE